ncbi:ABC transporter ATP-binding protein [Celeribacter indicus]|uniref:ABC transporter n=1 Tax=Celeribacter indicus TaxID=1208324 RepID=A0A0B5DTR3_9RHOB|nr:ABC transporter ATP-binding protein [Celeribacter indicus]AJE46818.1 ABC transporter [Celeribacter indicus]SDW81175.1 iron complex transport system ATP-binding protein [Celeribacter indicus]
MTLTLEDIRLMRGRKTVLAELSTAPLRHGEFVVLAGPNGAGKSSLLRAIAQTLPYEGRIALDGEDLARMKRVLRAGRIGYMPQQLENRSELTVLDSLRVAMNAGGTTGLSQREQIARAEALLIRFGCHPLATQSLAGLSGGQRQSVGLAQALARDPDVVLLDEPTAALDLSMQFRMLSEMRALAREGRLVIAVLHDLTQAAQWADRLVVLSDGRITADGAPGAVLTPDLLARVYNVAARVERDSRGETLIRVDGPAA